MIRLVLEFSTITELKEFLGEDVVAKLNERGRVIQATVSSDRFDDIVKGLQQAVKSDTGGG